MNSPTARGHWAESVAAEYLQQCGYHIIERNFLCSGGEIDIIAREDNILCFIEVRSLQNPRYGDPLETITQNKINRLIVAGRRYLEKLSGEWPPVRFDAISVVGQHQKGRSPPKIRLVREAFYDGA